MGSSMIKLAIRQVIDAHTSGAFARQVFRDSYAEFLLQSQVYNPDEVFSTFAEIVAHQPKANSLHYKTGFAVGLYIRSLNNLVPDTWDLSGNTQLAFEKHQFKIIASSIRDPQQHKVAILYYTADLLLHRVIGEYLLLGTNNSTDTFMLKLSDQVTICNYQELMVGFLSPEEEK